MQRDHTIIVDMGLYTLPTRFIGKTVVVVGTRAIVRVYCDRDLLKAHQRVAPRGRSIDHRDYPENRAAYSRCDPERLIAQADDVGAAAGAFARALLEGPAPWAKLRQVQALLRLAAKRGSERMEAACERTNAFDVRNTRRVEDILLEDLRAPAEPAEGAPAQLASALVRAPQPRLPARGCRVKAAAGPDLAQSSIA